MRRLLEATKDIEVTSPVTERTPASNVSELGSARQLGT
jgi:hypothetical protein